MINERLLEEFMSGVVRGPVLEIGISRKSVSILNARVVIESFDLGLNRFGMTPPGFRSGAMIRLPFPDNKFGGFVSKYVFDRVGDRGYFFKEILRIVDGPILMVENGVDPFPRDVLMDVEDIMVSMISVNGSVYEINQTWAQLFSRRDLRKLLSSPSGSLNKFNTLVPEDIQAEVGVLQTKTS